MPVYKEFTDRLLVLPFFIFDINNFLLFTTQIVPSDISDTKEIILTEQPVPGLNYQPVTSGGLGNRHLSFSLPVIDRDRVLGNVKTMKLFDNLRQPIFNYKSLAATSQFVPNPKVLFKWGVGSVPLIYYVKKCDMVHKQGFINGFGEPMYTEIQMELILDEQNPLNLVEKMHRQINSLAGVGTSTVFTTMNVVTNRTANFDSKNAKSGAGFIRSY